MPRTRQPYPPEFRQQMVQLVKAGRTPEELSREFEPTAQADQLEPGLPWVGGLVIGDDRRASTSGYLLVSWLTSLRPKLRHSEDALQYYQVIVDRLALSGYGEARTLQRLDE